MHTLGKSLQALGLVLPLVGLFHAFDRGGLSGDTSRGLLMGELAMLGVGVVFFFLGTRLIQRPGG